MKTLYEIGKSGLQASERSLSVTANNVINADTPGYSRQRVNNVPVGMQMSKFHTGLGVNISEVERLRHELVDIQLNRKRQDMGYMEEKRAVFEQLESSMVSDSGMDLDYRIGRMFDLFSELSSDPQDYSVRNSLVGEVQQLTIKFADMGANIDRNSELLQNSAVQTISKVNQLLSDIAILNSSIKNGQAAGKPDHTSLDLRTGKLEELSSLVDFETIEDEYGAMNIRISGVTVLEDTEARTIRPEVDEANKKFRLRLDTGKVIQSESGKLGAEIEMYEKEIPELKNRLDLIAETIVREVNAVHIQGYGLADGNQRNFFDSTGTTASTIKISDAIVSNVQHIAASDVDGESGNGAIAAQISDLRNNYMIGGRKVVDYSIDLISTPGHHLTQLSSSIESRSSEINMLETQQEREAGVNIDEELSMMIQYQNAYQGAARVMSAAQDMYDTLISLVR